MKKLFWIVIGLMGCTDALEESRNDLEAAQSSALVEPLPDPKPGEASIGPIAQQVPADLAPLTTFTWSQYQGYSTVMIHQNEGFCYLTRVTGNFVGDGEALWIDNSNGYWVLTGRSGQQGLGATATCVTWQALNAWDGASFRWAAWAANRQDPVCRETLTCGWTEQQLDYWESYCSLQGIGGAFDGFGEEAWLKPPSAGQWWNLRVKGLSSFHTQGWAGCVYVKGISFQTRTMNEEWIWNQGQGPVDLGPVSDRVCGFSSIRGHFAGAGESVEIRQIGGNWVLTGSSQQYDVQARAKCMKLTYPL